MPAKDRFCCITMIVLILICVSVCFSVSAEETFDIKRVGNIHPYADNAFRINASEGGSLEIRIHDNVCVYRTITEEIQPGETVIHWDGCGYNMERLYEKTYIITAELTTESGQIHSISFASPIEYASQCLQYALPSSDRVFLDDTASWFLEYRTVTKGTVIMELTHDGENETAFSYAIAATGGKIARKGFDVIAGKHLPPAGEYQAAVYEISKPDEKHCFSLVIEPSSPKAETVTVTGEIMPDRSMSDQEIWELMMKPSVVVDIDSFKHQNVYTDPDTESPSLGTLHGQTQGLKVIEISHSWAKIGAWNHEEAEYIEGWVPISKLKVEPPRGNYGILIDKQKQTLTVYRDGKVIDTLLISSGRAEKNNLYQETSAGCFLTGYHRVNFSMNGKKYDYVIQYDGGNLLHQTPYDWGEQKKDFTLGRGYLGAKASHACIRIQPEPGDGGLNAYWLFTHIPYHTRVIILDDPWEREATASRLKRTAIDDVNISTLHKTDTYAVISEDTVVITFGGTVIPGGSRSFNNRNESMAAILQKEGYGFPLSDLSAVFSEDDLTCISLGGLIQKESTPFPEGKGVLTATSGTEKIFSEASVELIQMAGEKLRSAGLPFYHNTDEILQTYAETLGCEQNKIFMLKGHLFGFTGCTENDYLKDPGIIDRKITELETAGCEKKIMLISWAEGHDGNHSIVQEAMAHRSVRAGADLVIGNCQGIVQGIDLIEGVPVIYSLGDLLNGSISSKQKKQAGLLIRAAFCFDKTQGAVSATVIPILPYGGSDTKANEYKPSYILNPSQAEEIIRYIWQDSTDAALDKICFYISDQL